VQSGLDVGPTHFHAPESGGRETGNGKGKDVEENEQNTQEGLCVDVRQTISHLHFLSSFANLKINTNQIFNNLISSEAQLAGNFYNSYGSNIPKLARPSSLLVYKIAGQSPLSVIS
jgi:hypothetical protein